MRRLRAHLPAAGIAGVLAVCCGAHLLALATIGVGVGAGALGQVLGIAAPAVVGAGIVGMTGVLLARSLRSRSSSAEATCCDAPAADPRSDHMKEAPAR